LKFYRDIELFDLIREAPPDADDVHQYAGNRLESVNGLSVAQRADLAERISTKAQGIFLYAAIVLDDLLPRLPNLPDLADYPLPDKLSGLYHDFLVRELGKDEDHWFESYEPLLGLLAVSQGNGLTTDRLKALTGLDVRQTLRTCKQYLSGDLPDGPFRLFHQSFVDFLLDDVENEDYHIDGPAMHRRIAEDYVKTTAGDWTKCDSYGLDSLAIHFFEGQQFDKLRTLITPAWMHTRVASAGYTYDGFVADVSLAWQQADAAARRQITTNTAPDGLADCIRYALVRTSINALAGNYVWSFTTTASLSLSIWSASTTPSS